MEFMPSNLNISKLKRKMDIKGLTVLIARQNIYKMGRFYMLWRDGIFIVIQAEPWWRPGFVSDYMLPSSNFVEERRALWHLQEVIQTMLDTIIFDGENNWAHLVRLRDGTYRLVYKQRRLVNNCPIWTKVVELDDVELTRFVDGLYWEGIYEGKDVDIFMGWTDDWGHYISAESRGQKLVQSRGVGHYFFDVQAHVSQSGVVVGLMMEALVGRCVTHADRSVVVEAVTDIQRHGITFKFQICDIFITERGVRFASASNVKYHRDRDILAEEAKLAWKLLEDIFNPTKYDPLRGRLHGSRSMTNSNAFIMPRLPSLGHSISLTPEEAIIRWIWTIQTSDDFEHLREKGRVSMKLHALLRPSGHSTTRRDKRIKGDKRALLPPEDFHGGPETSVPVIQCIDQPLVLSRGPVTRPHPYARPKSKRLLLPPQEPDPAAPIT